jgi:hypothetical protein
MSIYQKNLPDVFPHHVQAKRETVNELVKSLMEREDLPYGSSFAVTADVNNYGINLWLSDVSFNYLVKNELLSV